MVYLHGTEEWYCGNGIGACETTTRGSKPNYFAVGGAVGKDAWAGYGVGSFRIFASYIDYDGAAVSGTTKMNVHSDVPQVSGFTAWGESYMADATNSANATAFHTDPGSSATNSCWTVV